MPLDLLIQLEKYLITDSGIKSIVKNRKCLRGREGRILNYLFAESMSKNSDQRLSRVLGVSRGTKDVKVLLSSGKCLIFLLEHHLNINNAFNTY